MLWAKYSPCLQYHDRGEGRDEANHGLDEEVHVCFQDGSTGLGKG